MLKPEMPKQRKSYPWSSEFWVSTLHQKNHLRERKFIRIDKDNFDEVMTSMSPKAHFMVNSVIPGNEGQLNVELVFKCKDDFSPDNVIQQVDCLKNLSELRSQLCDLRNRAASNEKLKEKLQELLANTNDNSENYERKE